MDDISGEYDRSVLACSFVVEVGSGLDFLAHPGAGDGCACSAEVLDASIAGGFRFCVSLDSSLFRLFGIEASGVTVSSATWDRW